MQEFFIRQHSVNPVLEMELINDGRYDFQKSLINDALQDSLVTFNMIDEETGLLKVAKAPCNIILADEESCEERYILQYKWQKKDTNKEGVFKGWFEIKFNGDIYSEGVDYPEGNLIVPVEEDLRITIRK
jgi:hypothetical protein